MFSRLVPVFTFQHSIDCVVYHLLIYCTIQLFFVGNYGKINVLYFYFKLEVGPSPRAGLWLANRPIT